MDETGRTPDDMVTSAPNPLETATEPRAKATAKTADRPHPITIALGLLSPVLALVSLGVSFYVFHDSRRSMQVAQRAYLAFHFKAAEAQPVPATSANDPRKFMVSANVSVRDIGNTPAYVDEVRQELYVINADDMAHHIGGSQKTSPNFDTLVPRGDALLLAYDSTFAEQNLLGDRSIVYRIEVHWHDAFGENQSTPFCAILRGEEEWTAIRGSFKLSPEPCIKGMTFELRSDE